MVALCRFGVHLVKVGSGEGVVYVVKQKSRLDRGPHRLGVHIPGPRGQQWLIHLLLKRSTNADLIMQEVCL